MDSIKLLAVIGAVLLTACHTIRGAPPAPFKASKVWDDSSLKDLVSTLSGAQTNTKPVEDCKDIRNLSAHQLIAYVDVNYMNYRQSFVFDRQHADAISDGLQLMMTVAGGLTNSKGVKDNYLAGIAILTGGETIYDKSYLFEKTAPALATQMDAGRKEKALELLTKLEKLPCPAYPGQVVLADILDYYSRGTVVGAITETHKDAQAKDAQATLLLNELNAQRLQRLQTP